SSVQALAERHGLPIHSPTTLRSPEAQAEFAAIQADAAVVAAYGLILPAPILDAPRLGCLNVHASLLPRWRGAAPIQRAMLAGDAETGITIMQMDEGLDTGPILLQRAIPIGPATPAGQATEALAGPRARVLPAAAEPQAARAAPGTVLDARLSIACGEGALRPLRLQRPGRAALDTDAFLRGFALMPGTLLPCPATS